MTLSPFLDIIRKNVKKICINAEKMSRKYVYVQIFSTFYLNGGPMVNIIIVKMLIMDMETNDA